MTASESRNQLPLSLGLSSTNFVLANGRNFGMPVAVTVTVMVSVAAGVAVPTLAYFELSSWRGFRPTGQT